MEKISDSMKKILLAGIGAAATTAEKSKEILDDLVKKGELTVEQGKVLNEELKHNVKQTFKKDEQDPADVLKGMTPEQIEALKAAIANMEAKATEEKAEETTRAAASETAETTEAAEENSELDLAAAAGKHHVEITVKDYGTINVELDGDAAPITVANFLDLAGNGFYDGLTFHRIISGFMIQGGDPLGTGMGGSEREIKGEFDSNGVKNPLSHTRGAISMARAQRKDSASSQFFIVHEDSTFLDGEYACFGYVTDGMDVVDAICEDTKVEDNNGTVAKENQPVIESIKVID